jgi:hypothetical protein
MSWLRAILLVLRALILLPFASHHDGRRLRWRWEEAGSAMFLALMLSVAVIVGILMFPAFRSDTACVRPSLGPSWLWGCPP